MLLVIIGIAGSVVSIPKWLEFLFYLVPYFVIGYDILRKAWKGICNRQMFDENFLMAVATIGAIALGDYKEGVAVMLFYQIGELFQSYAVGKSRRNISDLMDIRPDYANIETDGQMEKVDPDEVEIGTVIIVQPGEKVPIDGVVVEGHSSLNTSALTGESVPREVAVGEEIISGCINISGLLKIRTTKEFGESTVSKILDLVENASSKKSRSENFISRFAHYYTPAVCYGALALAILPPLVRMLFMGLPADWGIWIYRALTFLVISCPCALGLATPVAIMVGNGMGAKHGTMFKTAVSLEETGKTQIVALDKTGTITSGEPQVTDLVPADGVSEEELLKGAFALEQKSEHPLARAILALAEEKGLAREEVRDFSALPGNGLVAKRNGKELCGGNRALITKKAVLSKQMEEQAAKLSEEGKTPLFFSEDGKMLGMIAVADVIKEDSPRAVKELQNMGIRVVMLTGDNERTARAIGAQAGVDEVIAGVLPDGKEAVISRLKEKGKVAIPLNNGFYLASFYLGAGATFFGEEGNEREAGIVLDNDETLAMTNALIDMVQNENLVVSSPEDAISMMREGNVNAYFCGTWQAAQTEEILGDNFGVAPLPSMTVDGEEVQLKPFTSSKAIGVKSTTAYPQVAIELAMYLGGYDSQKLHYETRGYVPCYKGLVNDTEIQKDAVVAVDSWTVENIAVPRANYTEMSYFWTAAESFGNELRDGIMTHENAAEKLKTLEESSNTSGVN